MKLTVIGCGDAFGSGGRFNTCFMIDTASKRLLLDCGASSLVALKAQKILAEKYNVATDVWSVTSYGELRREAQEVERWNRLHPNEAPKQTYIQQVLEGESGPIIAATDYMKAFADGIRPFIPKGRTYKALGTDGFGLSDTREALREFFSVDAKHVAAAGMVALARSGGITHALVLNALMLFEPRWHEIRAGAR